MTIIYQYRVATTSLGGFLRLLTIWRGSVYKLMYKEILIFSSMYAAISITYRLGLNEKQRHMFERLVIHCSSYTNLIPISFVLGFYVSIVVARWWQQFINVPWPDRTLFMTVTYLHGNDERARMFRRTLARYMILGLILICRSISVAVMKRFPTMEHVIDAGFITKEEVELWEGVRCKYHKFWVPLTWANNMLVTARREGRIESDWGMRMIIQQLADFRDKCSLLFVYDWITIPLVYTQVVTLAVYTFFAACLVARQYLDPNRGYEGFGYDLYVPVFTLLQFFFYMGWLKVAEQLINPFGEDDDDYDINWLLDRHTAVAMALIDQCYGKHPPLIRDMYWNENVEELPYTEASYASKRPNFLGSTYNIAKPSIEEQRIVNDLSEAPTRRSSVSSTVAGSLLSLFSRRHSMTKLHQQPECLILPKREDRAMSVPNGGPQLLGIPGLPGMNSPSLRSTRLDVPNIVTNWCSDSDLATRASMDPVERRRRAHTDIERCGDIGREKVRAHRKFSFPSALSRKRDNKHSMLGTETTTQVTTQQPITEPKQTRFMIEPVSSCKTGDGISVARRNSKKMENMFSSIDKMQYTKNVSRPPLLSAIEEQNTVTSLNQLMQQHQQQQRLEEEDMQNAIEIDDSNLHLASIDPEELLDEDAMALLNPSQSFRETIRDQGFNGKSEYLAYSPVLLSESIPLQTAHHRMTGWSSDSDLSIQRPTAIKAARLYRRQRKLKRPRYKQPGDDYHENAITSGQESYVEEEEAKNRAERKKYTNEMISLDKNQEENPQIWNYEVGEKCNEKPLAREAMVSKLRRNKSRLSSTSTSTSSSGGSRKINLSSWQGQKETAFTEKEPVTVVPQTKVQLSREETNPERKIQDYSASPNNPTPSLPQKTQPAQQSLISPSPSQTQQQQQQQQKLYYQQQHHQQQYYQQQQHLPQQQQQLAQQNPYQQKQMSQPQQQYRQEQQHQEMQYQEQPQQQQLQQQQLQQQQYYQPQQLQLRKQELVKELPMSLPSPLSPKTPLQVQKQQPSSALNLPSPVLKQSRAPVAIQKHQSKVAQRQPVQAAVTTQKQTPEQQQQQQQQTSQALKQLLLPPPLPTKTTTIMTKTATPPSPLKSPSQTKSFSSAQTDPSSPRRPKQHQPSVHFQPEVIRKDNRAQLASLLNRPLNKAPPLSPHKSMASPSAIKDNVNISLSNKITHRTAMKEYRYRGRRADGAIVSDGIQQLFELVRKNKSLKLQKFEDPV